MKQILLVLACLLGAMPASAQQAQQILEQTAERYRTLEQYHLEGDISVQMAAGGQQRTMDVGMLLAGEGAGRIRAELVSPRIQVTIVSDGDTTWMYVPPLNQYMRQAGTFNPAAAQSPVPDLLAEYGKLDENVERVELLREEEVAVGDSTRPSYVLSVSYTPRETAAGTDSSHKTLWIDRERLLVLRDETAARMASSPTGGPMQVDETTTFSHLRVDEPLPDSLFTFVPPEGATEVTRADIMGSEPSSDLVGRPAPGFTLENLDGEPVSLDALQGKVVLLNFWATWCGPCRVEMPVLQEIYQQYKDEDLVVLSVDLAEPVEDVRDYLQAYDYTFPVLLDLDGTVAARYGASAIPTSVIIDREGIVVEHFVGMRPESIFRQALQEVGVE